ncbi:MAG: aldo/keto reductase [Desulfurococcales archaeon]|nr:aldo/keto reductase [Desulfurococcales archaeon]
MLLLYGVYSVTGMYGGIPRSEALRLLKLAPSLGYAGFDTAGVYGAGLGEELLAEAYPRGYPLVATKVGYDYSGGRPVPRFDYEFLVGEARRAVERLGFKPVYLIQLHNPPLRVLRGREVYRAMRAWVEEGLALHAGVALGPEVDVLPEGLEALAHDEVEYIQVVYNMLEQEPGYTLARIAKRMGVGVIVRVPHAGGVLDETVTSPGEAPRDHRSLRRPGWYEWALRLYSKLKGILEEVPGTPAQKALAWIRDSLNPEYTVVTAPSEEKLREYTGYIGIPRIPQSLLERIREEYLQAVSESPERPTRGLLN